MVRILYRADAARSIGTGHVVRARRLFRQWKQTGDVDPLLVSADDPALDALWKESDGNVTRLSQPVESREGKPCFQAGSLLQAISHFHPHIVVIDMLDTDDQEMASIASTGVILCTLDDRGTGRFHSQCIINTLVAEPKPELLSPMCRLFEGPEFVVLDAGFAELPQSVTHRAISKRQNVMVSLGGVDSAGLTLKVAVALKMIPELETVRFITGKAFADNARLEAIIDEAPWSAECVAPADGLITHFEWCDVAIVAGGLTMFEACATGTPAIAFCQPVDHQWEVADRLERSGAMVNAGWGKEVSETDLANLVRRVLADDNLRQSMISHGPPIVDGKGTQRVAETILNLTSAEH